MQLANSGDYAMLQRRHFHTFDALRFFAFLKVFFLHLPIVAFPWFNYIKAGGGIGVQFFFVLSGFLITYIICDEKERTGKLNLKNFYLRRILRIWPLYYLMVAVAYATPYIQEHLLSLPHSDEGYEPSWWFSVLFLENYKMMITHDHANVSPLSIMWTLCIEEHFYLVWGLLLYFIKTKVLPVVIIVCLVLGIGVRALYMYYNIPTIDIFTNIDLFAFGAMPAYFLIKRQNKFEQYVGKIPVGVKKVYALALVILVEICSQFMDNDSFFWITSLLGLMFALLIMFTLSQENCLKINNRNLFSKMGIYTYGLYLYHILIIIVLRQVFVSKDWLLNIPINAALFIITSLIGTVICSYISYHIFEKHFLKLKRFFR